MRGELVSILASDQVRLEGMFVEAEDVRSATHATPVFDAAVISHGLGGNFYGARLLKYLAGFLTDRGISCVLGNNRGHDIINWSSRSAKLATIGAAFETVGECVHDINGWTNFLTQRGYSRILLVGHSLGAIKTLYSAARQQPESAAGIIALSATRLNHDRLMNSPAGEKFRRMIDLAGQMCADGKSDDLMRVEFPFPTWMTAAAYLEKYGPENRYDWFSFANEIQLPTLLMFGESELSDNPAFDGMAAEFEKLSIENANLAFDTIAEADHFYSFNYEGVKNSAASWIDCQVASR